MGAGSRLISREQYASELERVLPKDVFDPVPRRLLWILAHAMAIAAAVALGLWGESAILRLAMGAVIGNSLGTLGFLGHEILHGTVIQSGAWMRFFGGLCMLHWGIPPAVWIARHNGIHHRATNNPYEDPDCFGNEALYRHSRIMRFFESFTPGSRTLRSRFFLFIWFTFHFGWMIWFYPLFRSRAERRWAQMHYLAAHALWIAAAAQAPGGLLWLFAVPAAVSNFVMMSYVATNHGLSPLTPDCNDPLVNSLTVRRSPWVERMHLQNNFHVEHHLLPYVNPCRAERVREAAIKLWPDRYQEMGFWEALRRLYATPRIYRSDTVLVNPRTGETARTLLADYLDSKESSLSSRSERREPDRIDACSSIRT